MANKEINKEKKLFESISHPSAKQSNDFYFRDNFWLILDCPAAVQKVFAASSYFNLSTCIFTWDPFFNLASNWLFKKNFALKELVLAEFLHYTQCET